MANHIFSNPLRLDTAGDVFAMGECDLRPSSIEFANNSGSPVTFVLRTGNGTGGNTIAQGAAYSKAGAADYGQPPWLKLDVPNLTAQLRGHIFETGASAPTTGTADGGNTGGGMCQNVAITGGWLAQTITLTCIDDSTPTAEVFSVTVPEGGTYPNATVGVAYSSGGLAFELVDGTPDFAAGDIFTIAVTTSFKQEIYMNNGATIYFAPVTSSLPAAATGQWAIASRILESRIVAANTVVEKATGETPGWPSLRVTGVASDAVATVNLNECSWYNKPSCGDQRAGRSVIKY